MGAKLTVRIFVFLTTVLFSLSVNANSHIDLSNTLSGSIKVKLSADSGSNNQNSSSSTFTTISRFGTGFSLFLTSTTYFSSFNLQNSSMVPIRHPMDFEHQASSMILPFMAFTSVLGTSFFNYRTGTDNDLLAIMPVIPTWPGDSFSKTNSLVNFDYGFFLYFSKDF